MEGMMGFQDENHSIVLGLGRKNWVRDYPAMYCIIRYALHFEGRPTIDIDHT